VVLNVASELTAHLRRFPVALRKLVWQFHTLANSFAIQIRWGPPETSGHAVSDFHRRLNIPWFSGVERRFSQVASRREHVATHELAKPLSVHLRFDCRELV